jgi:hypothetical protein
MRTGKRIAHYAISAVFGSVLITAAAPAQAPQMALLGELQKGAWQVVAAGEKFGKRICLGDPAILLQTQHGTARCSRYVIEDSASRVRVSYRCGAAGHGVTLLRMETKRLVQIDTQGVLNNEPFSVTAEGRYVGAC